MIMLFREGDGSTAGLADAWEMHIEEQNVR
jgi:hypothetical protein